MNFTDIKNSCVEFVTNGKNIRLIERRLPLVVGIFCTMLFVFLGHETIIKKSEEIRNPYHLLIRLSSAENLRKGYELLIYGVHKGNITSLHYLRTDKDDKPVDKSGDVYDQQVIAVVSFPESFPVYANYRIHTAYSGVIAQKHISFDPGSADAGLIKPVTLTGSQLIKFQHTGNLNLIDGGTLLTSQNYDDPILLIAKVLDENKRNLRRIIKNSAEITEKINNGNGTIAALINHDSLISKTDETLRDTRVLVEEVRSAAENLRESKSPIEFLSGYSLIIFKAIVGGSL